MYKSNTSFLPAWVQISSDEELTDIALVDSLNMLLNCSKSSLHTLGDYFEGKSDKTPLAMANMLAWQMTDGQKLLQNWHDSKRDKEADQSVDTEAETLEAKGKPAWMSFPVEDIEKLSQEVIDLALQIQAMDQEARNYAIASIHAIKRRGARGDDLSPRDYESLYMERGEELELCIRTLEEIRAVADLLTVSAGAQDPLYFDDTLENIGCLIADKVKITMDKINNGARIS